jgi:hypothetical protein
LVPVPVRNICLTNEDVDRCVEESFFSKEPNKILLSVLKYSAVVSVLISAIRETYLKRDGDSAMGVVLLSNSAGSQTVLLYPEDGAKRLLRICGSYVPNSIASRLRRP